MKRSTMMVAVLATAVLLAGCGGGGGGSETWYAQESDYFTKIADPGSSTVTPPSILIQGTYNLQHFIIDYYDSNMVYQFSVTDYDVPFESGTMWITPTEILQDRYMGGNQYVIDGSYTMYWADTRSGTFYVNDYVDGRYDLDFSISGNDLDTVTSMLAFTASSASAQGVDRASIIQQGWQALLRNGRALSE